jgi:putative ABC transport system permease protein
MRPVTKSVVRKLRRMKWRTLAIALVVAMAMGMLVAGLYGAAVMDESVDRFFEESKMPDVFVELAQPVNASEVDAVLASTSGVTAYDLRLKVGGIYTYKNETTQVTLVGLGDLTIERISKLEVIDGKLPTNSGEAVAIDALGMEDKGIEKGATIEVFAANRTFTLNLTGMVRSPEYIFPSAYADMSLPTMGTLLVVYMPLEDLQAEVAGGDPVVNDIIVLVDRQEDKETVVSSLQGFEKDSVTYRENHPSVVFMDIGSAKLRNMFPVIAAIFLFIGFISVFMTMMRLVQTDSRYIGVLMSLGYKRGDIVTAYIKMGLIMTLIGAIVGTLFSFGFTQGIVGASLDLYMTIDIVFPADPMPFLIGIGFIALVVLMSVWIPVQLITRASVREALEYRPRTKVRTSRVLSGALSRLTRMGLRNTTRNPWRMLITILVVGMTIGTAGMWLVMLDSAFGYMSDQIDSNTWDLRTHFNGPEAFADVNGNESHLGLSPAETKYVIPFTQLGVLVEAGGKSSGALVWATDETTRTKDLTLREGRMDFQNAVISSKLADELGVGPGDTLRVVVGTNSTSMKVSGVAQEALALSIYTERDGIAALFPADSCNGAFIGLKDTDTADDTAAKVRANGNVAAVVVQQNVKESFEEILTMAQGFFAFFFLVSALITMVVAGSAVIISTMERDVEFATLDTLGFSKGKVAKVILAEMSVLGLFSALIGIPMAYTMAWLMAGVFEDVLFYFPVVLVLGATITTFVFGVVLVFFSSAMPIRYSSKLDTDKTIRERTAG